MQASAGRRRRNGPDTLLEVDPITGQATALIGDTGQSRLWGLAYWGGQAHGLSETGKLYVRPASLGRMFSRRALVRGLMVLAKACSVGVVGYVTISSAIQDMVRSAGMDAAGFAGACGRLALSLALRVCAVLAVLGAVDYVYQRWQHRQDLKMTRHEFLDELKRSSRASAGRDRSTRPARPSGAEVEPASRTSEV